MSTQNKKGGNRRKKKQQPKQEAQTYEVGYMKPPTQTQFSSENQPENPGRKNGSTTFRKEALQILQGMSDAMDGEHSAMGILARQLIALCVAPKVNGEAVTPSVKLAALREILDRLEGKPLQSLIIPEDDPMKLPLEWIIPIEILQDEQTQPETEGGD